MWPNFADKRCIHSSVSLQADPSSEVSSDEASLSDPPTSLNLTRGTVSSRDNRWMASTNPWHSSMQLSSRPGEECCLQRDAKTAAGSAAEMATGSPLHIRISPEGVQWPVTMYMCIERRAASNASEATERPPHSSRRQSWISARETVLRLCPVVCCSRADVFCRSAMREYAAMGDT